MLGIHNSPSFAQRSKSGSKRADRFCEWAAVFFFISLVTVGFQIDGIDNTLGAMKMVWTSGILGMTLAIAFLVGVSYKFPSVFTMEERKKRYLFFVLIILSFCLVAEAGVGYMNRAFAQQQTFTRTVVVVKKGRRYVRHGHINQKTAYLRFQVDSNGDQERIVVSKEFADSVSEGSIVSLEMKKGLFGFPFLIGYKAAIE